jgi:hypothetical protein
MADMADPTADVRRAALLLHALDGDSQNWLLTRLPDQRRAELQGLLSELSQLGIPRESELVHAVLDTAAAQSRTSQHALGQASPAQLWGAIQAERREVQAACLSLLEPAVRNDLLKLESDAHRRGELETAAEKCAVSPALRAAVQSAWLEVVGNLNKRDVLVTAA